MAFVHLLSSGCPPEHACVSNYVMMKWPAASVFPLGHVRVNTVAMDTVAPVMGKLLVQGDVLEVATCLCGVYPTTFTFCLLLVSI